MADKNTYDFLIVYTSTYEMTGSLKHTRPPEFVLTQIVRLPLEDWPALKSRVAQISQHCTWYAKYQLRVSAIYNIEAILIADQHIPPYTPVWVNWQNIIPVITARHRYERICMIRDFRPIWTQSKAGYREAVESIQPIAPWEVRHYGLY